jgi:hypothetical protein
MAVSRPTLSVIVSTRKDPALLLAWMEGLADQVRRADAEIIVATCADRISAQGSVAVRHLPNASTFDCRAAGFSAAAGDIVAFTEDHCVVPDDWCARILSAFAARPDLVMLGGAVANGSTARIADRMNYWMTFAAYAPGQVTAQHPCISQFAVRTAAVGRALTPGELEADLIASWIEVPGAIEIDPEMTVVHVQSHGFWKTLAVHFHNGRATGGYSPRCGRHRDTRWNEALRLAMQSGREHVRRTDTAFRRGGASLLAHGAYLLLIAPVLLCHLAGEFVGYRYGAGTSPHRIP